MVRRLKFGWTGPLPSGVTNEMLAVAAAGRVEPHRLLPLTARRLRTLSNEELRIYHNEYVRRQMAARRAKVRAAR